MPQIAALSTETSWAAVTITWDNGQVASVHQRGMREIQRAREQSCVKGSRNIAPDRILWREAAPFVEVLILPRPYALDAGIVILTGNRRRVQRSGVVVAHLDLDGGNPAKAPIRMRVLLNQMEGGGRI